jgi:5-methylcytosine-specific restriction enzyme A
MHVHHLTPISSNSKAREVDPINELRPVCPNCHAMLHKSDPPFSIEELQELIQATESMHEEPKP